MKGRRKSISLFFAIIMMLAALAACGQKEPLHEHVWTEATCTEPRTCKECGATEGEPLGHDYAEATCEEPKTCTRCGTTEGEALGHEWTYATLEAPKTCTKCGKTEGDAVVCEELSDERFGIENWNKKYFDTENVLYVSEKENDSFSFTFYDYDFNELGKTEMSTSTPYAWSWDCLFSFDQDAGQNVKAGLQTFQTFEITEDGKSEAVIKIYDVQGNEIAVIEKNIVDSHFYMDDCVIAEECNNKRYIAEVSDSNGEVIYYLDTQTWTLVDPSELSDVELAEDTNEEIEYDKEKYGWCDKIGENMDGYLVANADMSQWGYADKDFNEIAMYADATNFNINGYALVSDDGHSYDIIDRDFNVIAEDYIEGVSASSCGMTTPVFGVQADDKNVTVLYVK